MSLSDIESAVGLRAGDLGGDGVLDRVRQLGRDDLYFFNKAILGYADMTHLVHKGFCGWLQGKKWANGEPLKPGEENLRKVGLMPRGHFKTTCNMGDMIWDYIQNNDERQLLVNESAINSEYMLREIKGHFENNDTFRRVFPEAIPPDFNKTNWTNTSITLPRKGTYREPSIDTAGVTSKIVSRHYTVIKCDDLISDEAMHSPALMQKAKKFVNRLESLLVNPKEDTIDIIGTRWAYDDVYGHVIEKFPVFDVFVRKAIIQTEDGPAPFFPDRYTMEIFQGIIERDPYQWATQYANDPSDTTVADFRKEWLQWCTVGADKAVRFHWSDELHRWDLRALRFYVHVDPSMGESPASDYSGIMVVGLSPREQIFLVDAISMRLDPVRLVEKMLELAQFYRPKNITIESNAYQKSLIYFLEKEAKRQRVYVNVVPSHSSSATSKEARIRAALQPIFSSGKVWVRKGLANFVEEYLKFGRSEDDHLMDALSQGPEIWRFPVDVERIKKENRRKLPVASRGITGYGA